MYKILLVMFCFLSCSEKVTKINEKVYELSPFSYRLVSSTSIEKNAIKMTPTDITGSCIDRVEISEYLENNGCVIYYCDWTMIIFKPEGDRVDFIMKHAKPLSKLANSL